MDTKAPVGATIATTTIRRSYAAEVKPYCKLDDVDHPDLKYALNESRSLARIYTELSHCTMSPAPRVGSNVMLAAVLALLSYIPFAYVAKGTLLLAVLLFVLDPMPPLTRLLSLVSVVMVAILSKLHRQWLAAMPDDESAVTIEPKSKSIDTKKND
jgi:hypothetical protein